jgi:phosphonate transport system substrate-binding protein
MVACKDANDYQEKIKNGYFDFTIINGQILLDAIQTGYSVVAKMGDDDKYKAVIFVRNDSAIKSVADLKGKTIATSNPQALAGTMMPLLFLYKKGLDVNKDIKHLYSPSFESALMNVYFGKCSAGASKKETVVKTLRQKPEMAAKLSIMWETPQLINNAVLIKNTMEKTVGDELTRLIITLQNSEEGKKALIPLGISKFEKANASTYRPLKEFMKEYDAVIH